MLAASAGVLAANKQVEKLESCSSDMDLVPIKMGKEKTI
jgi:hypothetical protein